MSCNYCWNQPKKYGKYDMYLDGKLTANEVIYKTLSENGKKENVNLDTKIKEIEKRLKVHFTFQTVTELPEVGEETVIYLVSNEKNSGDKDSYNEYMWVKKEENGEGEFELIGSGTYAKQTADLYTVTGYTTFDTFDDTVTDGVDINSRINKEIADRIADVDAEEKRAIEAESELKNNINEEVKLKTSQINDLNQEIKQNRNRIIDLENKVSTEINRAIEAENNLLKKFDDYATKANVSDVDIKFADYTSTTVLEENYSTKAELNAVDEKYSSLEE